jgi:uncharacterized membrane protein
MKSSKISKKINPLPYPLYYVLVLVFVVVGFFNSIYLSVSHFKVYTDMGYQSFCAISQSLNCDTVSQSTYSVFWGVPVAVWGIIGYSFFLTLLIFAWPSKAEKKRVWTVLFGVAAAFSVYSIILAVISTYRIQSYCIMCILSYAVNLALLFLTWLVRKRFQCEPIFKAFKLDVGYLLTYPRGMVSVGLVFGITTTLMVMFFPLYWQMSPPVLSTNMPTGVTEEGYPWIGAENPVLVIVEFSDYRCFQCKKMHFFLRRLIQQHPEKIRLVHRHFPMDHTVNPIVDAPFHEGAARLAIVALFASENGKFWRMNDILFSIDNQAEVVTVRDFAQQADIPFEAIKDVFRNQHLWAKLGKDIRDGIEYGLTGTPGYLINGQIYLGQIPAEVLRKYI